MDTLYIVIPSFNEEAYIATAVRDWSRVLCCASPDSRLLVIDGGSRDKTLPVLESLRAECPQLETVKTGLAHGPSCVLGYKTAIERGADYVFQTDSDGQTDPADFAAFWQLRETNPFVFGVRRVRGDGLARKAVSLTLRAVVRAVFGVWVKDANVPFRLMRCSALKNYLPLVPEDFFLANVLLTAVIAKRGGAIAWREITFTERKAGVNSINLPKIARIGVRAARELWIQKKRLGF